MNRTVAYAYAGVVLTMFFWGSAFNAMSYIIHHMPPLSAASERFSIASLALLLIFSITGKLRWAALSQNLFIYLIIGVVGIAGDIPAADAIVSPEFLMPVKRGLKGRPVSDGLSYYHVPLHGVAPLSVLPATP